VAAPGAPKACSLLMSRDYTRGTMCHRHHSEHGVHAGRAREGARVRNIQASYTPDPMFGINYGRARACAHAARCHLMKGDEQDLVRSPFRRVPALEPVLARAVRSRSV